MKIATRDITMVSEKMLVKLHKPTYKKVMQTKLDHEANKDKGPEDIKAVKEVEEKILLNMQTVEILAIDPSNRLKLEIGDLVIVDARSLREFDMHKDVFITDTYQVIGKVNLELDGVTLAALKKAVSI